MGKGVTNNESVRTGYDQIVEMSEEFVFYPRANGEPLLLTEYGSLIVSSILNDNYLAIQGNSKVLLVQKPSD